MTQTPTKQIGKRAVARLRAIRRQAAAWRRRTQRALTLALIVACGIDMPSRAFAQQVGQSAMAPAGGVVNRAVAGFQDLNTNGPGLFYYGINAADRGLGYNGSYMTFGGFVPYAEDDLGGAWSADLRSHLSGYGGFFSNVGIVRKQFLGGSLLGVGVYWDYDGDMNQYPASGTPGTPFGQFGHAYNQVGVSGEWLTDFGNLRSNGYMPVGTTSYTAGSQNYPFYQNFVMCQNGLDTALTGVDLEVGAYVPGLSDWAGMISVGGYALGNARYDWSQGPQAGQDVVPWFGGVYTRLDMTFVENWDFSLQYNNDSVFDSTGFARLTYRMGGSRRRNVPDQMEQPMMRNEHIVRAHQTPIVALNPNNGNAPWRVIHVDNSTTSSGTGTAASPFNTLAAGNAAATSAWDVVFVERGTGTAVGYDTRFSFLAPNQFLVGNGNPFYLNTLSCGLKNIATTSSQQRPLLSNPLGASIAIDGATAPGAVVSNFDITGSATGIYATGNLSSGMPRSGPTTPISYASPTGDTVVMDVTVNGAGAGQTGVFLDGDPSGSGLLSATPLDGAITFYNTAINDTTLFGLRVDGPSTPTFNATYNGSIETAAADNIVLVSNMTGGSMNVAVGNAPAGSTVLNQVTATGGGGIQIADNTSDTTILIDNVTLSDTVGPAILVENDSATTVITSGNGGGITRADSGAAIAVNGGAPILKYQGSIDNSRAAGSGSPSYLLSVQNLQAPGDVQLLALPGSTLTDNGDGILVSNAQSGSNVKVMGAKITSAGSNGILVNNSSGTLLFKNIDISGASTAGVAMLENQAGLDAKFEGLTINLSGASANGFLANTSAGASYNISALGGGNSITTASTTTPAVSIESTGTGSPILDMTFQSISAGVPSGGNNALVFGAGATGSFNVTGSFTVNAGSTNGSVATDVTSGGVTVTVPP